MSTDEIERSIRTAIVSLGMEDLHVDEKCVAWCWQMLAGEITPDEYLQLVISRAGT